MPTDVGSLLASAREKRDAALKTAEFYEQMIAEIEKLAGSGTPETATGSRKSKKPTERKAAAGGKAQRKKPVKAEVSASEAVLGLLSGCKMGLPSSEIVKHVTTTHGHKASSVRTTLYNLKKAGAIVQGEDGLYNHPENVG